MLDVGAQVDAGREGTGAEASDREAPVTCGAETLQLLQNRSFAAFLALEVSLGALLIIAATTSSHSGMDDRLLDYYIAARWNCFHRKHIPRCI